MARSIVPDPLEQLDLLALLGLPECLEHLDLLAPQERLDLQVLLVLLVLMVQLAQLVPPDR